MTQKHLSIIDLSKGIGVSYEMARRYATGTGKPNWERMNAIARFLDVDVNWLAYGDAHGEKPTELPSMPMFKLSSKEIMPTEAGDDRVRVPVKADLCIKVDNPMGCQYSAGDYVFIKTGTANAGDSCLIKANDEKAFVTYLIRKMKFNQKMQPYFVPASSDFPDLTTDEYTVVGTVIAVLSMS